MTDQWETQTILARYFNLEEVKALVRKTFKNHTDAEFSFKVSYLSNLRPS